LKPRKVARSGIGAAVEGQVLIYIHKEQSLADIAGRHPARHYVMVDDKLRLLAAMKKAWGERLTTVFACQGSYALDVANETAWPRADLRIDAIAELLDLGMHQLTLGRYNA